jgi:hypothetical protein
MNFLRSNVLTRKQLIQLCLQNILNFNANMFAMIIEAYDTIYCILIFTSNNFVKCDRKFYVSWFLWKNKHMEHKISCKK